MPPSPTYPDAFAELAVCVLLLPPQLLEILRQEMLLMSKFEGLEEGEADKALPEYVRSVRSMADVRAHLSERFWAQFSV